MAHRKPVYFTFKLRDYKWKVTTTIITSNSNYRKPNSRTDITPTPTYTTPHPTPHTHTYNTYTHREQLNKIYR